MDQTTATLAISGLVCAIVGGLIGQRKSRPIAGFLLGGLFGPIGWLAMAFADNHGPKCPKCLGEIVPGAVRCKNCGADLLPAAAPTLTGPLEEDADVIASNAILAGISAGGRPPTPAEQAILTRAAAKRQLAASRGY